MNIFNLPLFFYGVFKIFLYLLGFLPQFLGVGIFNYRINDNTPLNFRGVLTKKKFYDKKKMYSLLMKLKKGVLKKVLKNINLKKLLKNLKLRFLKCRLKNLHNRHSSETADFHKQKWKKL